MNSRKPSETFNWVNIFDGGLGRDGQYTWHELPRSMTRHDSETYCRENQMCPPEGFSVEPPRGYTSNRTVTP